MTTHRRTLLNRVRYIEAKCVSSKKLERDKRIELSPPPWQGGVLPLYESRSRGVLQTIFYNTPRVSTTTPCKTCANALRLNTEGGLPNPLRISPFPIHFQNASCLHNRGLFLAVGET